MSGMQRARPPARGLREREFHAWLARSLLAGRSGLLPLGDDAAALRPPHGAVLAATTDSLVEGTHFLAGSPPERIGRAAAGVSLSDLAAKGATPAALLLALVVPPGTPRGWPEAVVRGAERLSARFGAHLVGGDTKAGPVRAVVSTALGWGRAGRLAPRTGARPGDVLLTTGTVGRGGVAYDRLRRGGGSRDALLRALLDVRPRVREGVALAPYAHAMLDTSDGLAESGWLLAAASRVRVAFDEASLPIEPALARRAVPPAERRTVAFFGGDYELLAAIPPARAAAAVRAVRRAGGRLTVIGSVARGRGAVLRTATGAIPLPRGGWDPFASPLFGGPGRRSAPTVGRSRRVHVTLK